MNSFLGPLWALLLALVLAVPAVAGQGIVTIYGVTSNGGSPPTYTCNVSSSAGITVGDHVMAKTTSAGATGVWLVTSKPSATSVVLQDSLTQETGTAFGAPLANVTNGLAYGTPESGTSMIPDGASWWAAAARRNYVVLAEAAPDGSALTRVDDTNVTLTLGGTPATALLQATSLTLGWTGTLAESRGGTGAASLSAGLDAAFGSTRGSILYRGASGWVVLAPGTSGYALVSNGAGADPSYQAVTTPTPGWDDVLAVDATSGTSNPSINSGQRLILARAAGAGVGISSGATRTLNLTNEAGSSANMTIASGSALTVNAGGTGLTFNATAGDMVFSSAGYAQIEGTVFEATANAGSCTFTSDSGDCEFNADNGRSQFNSEVHVSSYVRVGSYLEGSEIADPAAPAADMGRIYFRDNGSGTTQLVTKMSGGTAIVLATDGVSAPTLAQVLAAGADGNAVDQTNLGSLTLASGKTIGGAGNLTISAADIFVESTGSGDIEFAAGDDVLLNAQGDDLTVLAADEMVFQPGSRTRFTGSGLVTIETALTMPEVSDQAAPAGNSAVMYVRDNGSGKTQFVVRFPTGAVQVIATEP